METIRCPRCNKLLRADAQSCSRCGAIIPARRTARKIGGSTDVLSQPTHPPASPHRAGHYSGLHPEDQPFQSSFFQRIQRSPESFVAKADMGAPVELEENAPAILPQQSVWTEEARAAQEVGEGEEDEKRAFGVLADLPTLPPRRTLVTPIPDIPTNIIPRKPARKTRLVHLLIGCSLICFLMASSLLAFLLLSKSRAGQAGPRLLALPGELRVGDTLQLSGSGFAARHAVTLLRDARAALRDGQGKPVAPVTNEQGAFQALVPITAAWSIGVHRLEASQGNLLASTSLTIQAALAGLPRLQLGVSHIDLGAGNPGTLSHKNMTLTNAGGGQVAWTAKSSVSWLSLNPSGGVFAGNALVVLTVNRSNLAPQAYLGQVLFTQKQGSSQTLYVSMTVDTTQANLVLSTASLAFAGSPAQSPAGQEIVIQNSGGQTLNWTAGSTTSDGTNWLSTTPASGTLSSNASAVVTVNVDTLNMALGTYQGSLNFSYAGGPAQQVAVTLTVNPPPQPIMHVLLQSLSFATNQGFNPPPQSFAISNTGNAPLDWVIHANATGQTYLGISPVSGSVPPGQSVRVSIAPLLGSANGTINSTLTIQDSDSGTTVPAQQVKVSIAITNQPIITPFYSYLEFDHDSTYTDTSELLIFSNSGSLPLHWALTQSAPVPWLSVDTTSGTLAAGSDTYVNVECVSSQMKPGTYTVTLTIKDTDKGTVVAPQAVTVTLVVSG